MTHFIRVNGALVIWFSTGSNRIPVLARRNLVFFLVNVNGGLVVLILDTKDVGGVVFDSVLTSSSLWNRQQIFIVILLSHLRRVLRVRPVSSWRDQIFLLKTIIAAKSSSLSIKLSLRSLSCTVINREHLKLGH